MRRLVAAFGRACYSGPIQKSKSCDKSQHSIRWLRQSILWQHLFLLLPRNSNVRFPTLLVAALLSLITFTALAEEHRVIDVWPGKPPGTTTATGPEEFRPLRPNERANVQRLTNVSQPTLTLYDPPADKHNGAAVIVCPGGGYNILAWDLEGTEVAEWLNTIGVTALVLKYRVPDSDPQHVAPLLDAQRAVSLVRSQASELKIDPARLGILGFSAGGNLAGGACLKHETRAYEKIDAVDEVSCRPDFGVLIYAAYFIDDSGKLKAEYQPTDKTPPLFFAHAINDGVKAENSIELLLALKAAGVPGELHVYDAGGHGFGLRKSEFPCHTWPQRCAEWMERRELLK